MQWDDFREAKRYKRLFGLIGYPLSHSFSKKYFSQKFQEESIADTFYELFPLPTIDDFQALIAQFPNLVGINVTIPYKQAVIPYLTELDEGAASVGAVNTIHRVGKQLKGYNTDVYGFEQSLQTFLTQRPNTTVDQALVLGTGGAAKAVAYVLKKMDINYHLVSRSGDKGDLRYQDISPEQITKYPLIINTTPLGMAPNITQAPALPYKALQAHQLLFDLVYNPEKTLFLIKGAEQACAIQNGLPMLYFQAEKAWSIWNA